MSARGKPELLNRELRPELLSRRGEFVAWGSTLLAAAAWVILALRGQRPQAILVILVVFLLLSALALSLGNWVDRRTAIRIADWGIQFENGLRQVKLRWDEIHQVHVFDSRMGSKVRVLGERTYFDFRTLAEIQLQGKVKGHMGFREGEAMLEHILEAAELKPVDQSEGVQYYARE